jgi:nucleotide-binding universal stress UspA family protein
MSYRKILAPIFGAQRDHVALETAFELAKQFTAHVEALFVRADPTVALPLGYIGDMSGAAAHYAMEAAIKAANEAQEIAQAAFAKATDTTGIPVSTPTSVQTRPSAELRIEQGDFADQIERRSRLCDLIMFGGAAKDMERPLIHEGFESALMSGARPVLFVPQQSKSALGQRIGIAYDGSAAAAHAVTGALPFLERAKELHAFEVTSEKETHLDELQAYLHLRGLRATAHLIDPGTAPTGDALVQTVQARGCDLLVLGGYGHSRVREFVFGGVTRHVLRHRMPFAVLLAH